MLTTSVGLSREGYSLSVVEVPLWAYASESVFSWLCMRLDHRLCQCPWLPGFRIGQALVSVASRRERRRWTTSLRDDEVRRCFPESWIELDAD